MRGFVIAVALAWGLSASAQTQPPPQEPQPSPSASSPLANPPAVADGSAVLSPEAGKLVQAMLDAGGLTKAGMRGVFTQLIAEGVKPPNRDFAAELEAGKPFKLTYGGKILDVKAVPADVAHMGALLNSLPNLRTLWDAPEKTEDMIELSRWGAPMESRIIVFIGGLLDDASQQSSAANAYAPYVGMIGTMWNSLKKLTDKASRERAHALFTAGLSYSFDKATKDNRKPPEPFLWQWTQSPDLKTSFINGG